MRKTIHFGGQRDDEDPELITDEELWDLWKGKMPVIYNVEEKVRPALVDEPRDDSG